MRRYILQLFKFFALLLLTCLLFFGALTWIIRKNANFKFAKNYKYIMLGHSHPECAYNDSLISNFKNISSSGEAYFYTYYKLIEVLKDNPNIETVMIEFTNNQVDSAMDRWIWGDKSLIRFYPKYGAFVNLEDNFMLAKNSNSAAFNSFSILQKRNFLKILNSDYKFDDDIGGYVHYEKNAVEEAKLNQIKKKKNYPESSNVSVNAKYLQKIIWLCKKRGKNLILIRTPQHNYLKMRDNGKKYLDIYRTKFSEIPLIDFNDFPIPDYGYKDLEHLNYKGANIISKTMDSLIRNHVIDSLVSKKAKRVIINN